MLVLEIETATDLSSVNAVANLSRWTMSATDHLAAERELIRVLFVPLDRGDLGTVSSYLHDDVVVILSNREPIRGASAFADLYAQVAGTLAGLRHEIHDVWRAAEDPASGSCV